MTRVAEGLPKSGTVGCRGDCGRDCAQRVGLRDCLLQPDQRRTVPGKSRLHRTGAATIAAEVAADLVQPWHALAGMVRPRQIQWRSRAIRLDGDGVSYR